MVLNLVGYAEHSKAFRFHVIKPNEPVSTNSIIESRDAIFGDNRFSSVPRPSQKSLINRTEDIDGSVVPEEIIEEVVVQQPEPELRKSKRNMTPKKFRPEFRLYLIERTKDEDVAFWKKVINDEMDSMMGNNTWVLDDLPPVARISIIRLLIALSSIHNMLIHQMDAKTTFLNGDLNEEVYMNQPHRFIMPSNEDKDQRMQEGLKTLKIIMDPNTSLEILCLGVNKNVSLNDGFENEGQWEGPEYLDTADSVVLGRSFLTLEKGILDFGNGIITIYPDQIPFNDDSDDDLDEILANINVVDLPPLDITDIPPFMCSMGKSARNKKQLSKNYKMSYNGEGPSLTINRVLTREELSREELEKDLCVLLDKLKLDGELKLKEEEANKEMVRSYKAIKEKNDPTVFVLPIRLEAKFDFHALADTGSNINVIPYRIYDKLGREKVKFVSYKNTMLHHFKAEPMGILKDVLCQVGVMWRS
ncbi:zinc finger, CCHC-type containing protein [Tanacetum coccineum]